MKPWYVKIRFGGPYVTGFIAPQAKDEKQAIRQVKLLLLARLEIEQKKGNEFPGDDFHPNKIKQYLRSLRRPWRFAGEYRKKKGYQHTKEISNYPVVSVVPMVLPCKTDYWIEEIVGGQLRGPAERKGVNPFRR